MSFLPTTRRIAKLTAAGVALIVVVSFARLASAKPDAKQVAQQIDRLLAEDLFNGQTQLAPRVDDATYLRRVWLDLAGDIPSPEDVTAFLLDPAEDKRVQVVRRLLAEPRYGLNWARYWHDVISYRRLEGTTDLYTNPLIVQLTDRLNRNVPWNEIARDFITATGDVRENGATAIVAAQQGRTEEIAAEMSRIFLGVQIQCAQCHDHPYDRWKREQFHELAAFFTRVGLKPVRAPARRSFEIRQNDRPDPKVPLKPEREVRLGTPEHYMPDLDDPSARGTRMQPKFFLTDGEIPLGAPDAQRRGTIAQWMTTSPWFATAYVNRIWSELVGEGFYEPVDDLGPDRTPSAPRAVEYLRRSFVDSGYDMKWLFEVICATDAYQRECRPRRDPSATPMTANVAQPLRGDQLYNAILSALAVDESDGPLQSRWQKNRRVHPKSARKSFDETIGFDPSDPRELVSSSIPQTLAMMNMGPLNRAITQPGSDGLLTRLLPEIPDDESLVEELYLRTLSREPTDEEVRTSLAFRKSVASRRAAFEDLLWALLNSAEFSHRR